MTSSTPQDLPGNGLPGLLRPAALIATVAGAVGSVVFTLMVGRHNGSRILQGLFIVWVLAPFIAGGLADRVSRRWSVSTRMALYGVMLVVALGSLLIYGTVALGPPRPKPAAVFLIVPLGSWLFGMVVVPLVAVISRRQGADGTG
jgi:hypothetical protein